jgi:hypothetical protein
MGDLKLNVAKKKKKKKKMCRNNMQNFAGYDVLTIRNAT